MKRGERRKTLKLNNLQKEQGSQVAENTEIQSKETQIPVNNEVTIEQVKSINVGDSPLMEAMIERKGGDDFLYKDKPVENAAENIAPQKEEVPNNTTPAQGNNPPPPSQGSGPKEFIFDPIAQDDTVQPPNTGTESSAETNPIPPEIADESSRMIAEMLLEGFGMIAPEMADRYSKINEGQIRKLERDDKIQTGLVDIVKAVNKENKGAVKVTTEQKNLIRKPLIKVLEVQGVKASPETMLIIAVLAVCVMLFIQARSIKQSNDDMVRNWMEDHSRSKKLEKEVDNKDARIRELEQQLNERQAEQVPYAQVEVVS